MLSLSTAIRFLWTILLLYSIDIFCIRSHYSLRCYFLHPSGNYSLININETFSVNLRNRCESAVKIDLHTGNDIVEVDSWSQYQLDFLLSIKNVSLCISIVESGFVYINLLMEDLSAVCEGYLLDISGNNELESITTGPFLRTIDPKRVRIRGNRKLNASQLTPFQGFPNVQEGEECFVSQRLEKAPEMLHNCTNVYGIFRVKQNINASGWKNFKYVGCIQIENSLITDLKFLDHIEEFKPIDGCDQFIKNNANLCVENPSAIHAKFPGIYIYNNKANCARQCKGGIVNEEYLNDTSDCETRIGDVIIKNWTEKPSNINVLLKTKFIQGRLHITYNEGLGSFHYLKNVEEIGTPDVSGPDPALNVLDNVDLDTLEMPKLKRVVQATEGIRVRISGNGKLKICDEEAHALVKAAGGEKHADLEYQIRVPCAHSTSSNDLSEHEIFKYFLFTMLVLVLLVLLCMFLHRVRSAITLPRPPFKLPKKSQSVLLDMTKEIIAKNPMVWRVQDRPLIWRYSENDPAKADVTELKNKHRIFLKNHQAKILKNGTIPLKDDQHLMTRIKDLLPHKVVVMISNKDIASVVPHMPNEIGKFHCYGSDDSTITFRLLSLAHIGERTIVYVYNVVVVKGRSKKETKTLWRVVLYEWDQLRLPIVFGELLQVLKLYTDRKSVLVSNRRKEIFSLLHLIYTHVVVLQKTIGVEEAFKLHTDNCNGAPLDSHEMLCVMAFILEWAHQSYSIPKDLVKKHAKWCYTYARMSHFSKTHPSVMIIRPEHLTTSSRQEELIEELDYAGPSAGAPFAERPQVPMKDKLRLRTEAERTQSCRTPKDLSRTSRELGTSRELSRKRSKTTATAEEKQEDDLEEVDKVKAESLMLTPQRYRASKNDPIRKAEEERIAQALKKRQSETKMDVRQSAEKGSISDRGKKKGSTFQALKKREGETKAATSPVVGRGSMSERAKKKQSQREYATGPIAGSGSMSERAKKKLSQPQYPSWKF